MSATRWTPESLRERASWIESILHVDALELNDARALRALAAVIEATRDALQVPDSEYVRAVSQLCRVARIARGEGET